MFEWIGGLEWANKFPWGLLTIAVLIFGAGGWVATTSYSIRSLRETVAELKKTVIEIKKTVTEIKGKLDSVLAGSPPQMFQFQSPVRLTSIGRKISSDAGAKKWAGEHVSKLMDDASGKEEFEIFELCVKYVKKQHAGDKSLRKTIASKAYEHGVGEDQIRRIFEIELRDKLLEPIKKGKKSDAR